MCGPDPACATPLSVFGEATGGSRRLSEQVRDLPLPTITARVILTATTRNSASVSLAAPAAVRDRNPPFRNGAGPLGHILEGGKANLTAGYSDEKVKRGEMS